VYQVLDCKAMAKLCRIKSAVCTRFSWRFSI